MIWSSAGPERTVLTRGWMERTRRAVESSRKFCGEEVRIWRLGELGRKYLEFFDAVLADHAHA